MKTRTKWLIGAGMLAVVGALVWANLRMAGGQGAAAPAKGPKDGPLVKVVKATKSDLTQRVLAPGTLEATAPREIRAPFTTPAVKLLVGEGDQVKEGQVIAELESADLRLQLANQEAEVARAEATLAEYYRQRDVAPLQFAQKVESARAQLLQAEQNLARQGLSSRERLEQARAGLLSVQSRSAQSGDQVSQARQKLAAAEAEYRANPLSAAAVKAYEDARTGYEQALQRSTEEARQIAAETARAHQSLQLAEQELDQAAGDEPAVVSQARSQLENARLALEIARREAEAGGALAEQVRSAEAQMHAARAALEHTRAKLEQASLKAPAAGTILTAGLTSGQPAQQNQLLFVLAGTQTLTVKARVDEIDVVKVQLNQPLDVRVNAYQQEKFPGKVTRVAAQSTPDQRGAGSSYEVQGEVPNPGGKLRAGMAARASILADSRSGVIVIGVEALRETGDEATVLVVKEFKAEERKVKLGLRTQTLVEVTEGLQEGDLVVVAPFTQVRELKDGTGVRYEETEPQDRGDEE